MLYSGLDPVIAHLDLKTPNVILDSEYNAKLCDFGKTQESTSWGVPVCVCQENVPPLIRLTVFCQPLRSRELV